jgi:uroporphyrin-III C-methyltransferase
MSAARPPVVAAGSGRCILVGAGPGDPELLTIKAARAIAAADVLLVDDLVGDDVLAHARPDARIVHVGKRGGCRSTPQAFIERLMIAEARAGRIVVRLKGGDPFVFGRGGEEVEALRAAGIGVEVVPGITAGLAAAGALGVPLTHRTHAHGVVFVTGHASEDSAAIDWPRLGETARSARLTLVIYMGMGGLDAIADGLLAALPAATPAAVVQHASGACERRLATILGALAATVRQERIASPAIVVVGDVVRGARAWRDRLGAAAGSPLSARA